MSEATEQAAWRPQTPALTPETVEMLADALLWAHGRLRRLYPDMPPQQRISMTAGVVLAHLDSDSQALALVGAALCDRLTSIPEANRKQFSVGA